MKPRPLAISLVAAALLALLGPGRALAGPAEDRAAAQAELEALAPRIEQLKREGVAGRGGGAELERLLARAQALAAQLEQPPAPARRPPAPGPDAQELRERADALRDQADKAAAALAEVDRRLAELARRAALAERLEALGTSSDLFADSAPRRRGASAPFSAAGTTTIPGPAVGAVPPATALRATAEPAGAGAAPGAEETGQLRRRRDELSRTVGSLRARAEQLDAEARSVEAR